MGLPGLLGQAHERRRAGTWVLETGPAAFVRIHDGAQPCFSQGDPARMVNQENLPAFDGWNAPELSPAPA